MRGHHQSDPQHDGGDTEAGGVVVGDVADDQQHAEPDAQAPGPGGEAPALQGAGHGEHRADGDQQQPGADPLQVAAEVGDAQRGDHEADGGERGGRTLEVAAVEHHGDRVVGEPDEQRHRADRAGLGELPLVLEAEAGERQEEDAERQGHQVADGALLDLLQEVEPQRRRRGRQVEGPAAGVGDPGEGDQPRRQRDQRDGVDREREREVGVVVGQRDVEGGEAQKHRHAQARGHHAGRGERAPPVAGQQHEAGDDHHQRQEDAQRRVGLLAGAQVGRGVVARPDDDADEHHQHPDPGEADADARLGPPGGPVAEVVEHPRQTRSAHL